MHDTIAKKPKKKVDWASEARQIFWLVLAVLGVHSLLAKPFYIPSESMLPTLLTGDRLIVSKFPYGYSYLSPSLPILPYMPGRIFGRLPEPGDIAVVKSPIGQIDYIKRVVALPGQQVQMRDGRLYIDGVAVRREALPPTEIVATANTDCLGPFQRYRFSRDDGTVVCRYPRFRETLPNGRSYETIDAMEGMLDNTSPEIVPAGHVYLMGDNRDNSEDSRVPPALGGVGMLPVENLVGRAEFLTFSLDGSTVLWNPLTWFSAVRPGRKFESLHPETN